MKGLTKFLGAAVALGLCGGANAAIVSTTGAVTEIAAPASVRQGALESDTTIYAFDEQAAEGLQSTFLHFDKVGNGGAFVSAAGTITFDTPIVAVLWHTDDLNATDALYGVPNDKMYFKKKDRGAETESQNFELADVIEIVDDFTLSVDLHTNFVDQIRVLTAVPLPPAVWLLGSALMGLVAIGRRKAAA
jgi:hypothetical protein